MGVHVISVDARESEFAYIGATSSAHMNAEDRNFRGFGAHENWWYICYGGAIFLWIQTQ